jgi:GntR family transcriptional regulator / MocR family aminotransferase
VTTSTSPTPLAVQLDRDAPDALPVQLARQIRARVADGTLVSGQRLPSSRALARELGVARAVVETAFDQLLAEGWVVTRQGAGTFVHDVGRSASGAARAAVRRRSTSSEDTRLVSFDTGTPFVDPRLAAGWRRAWREAASATMPRGYPDPAGAGELRELLAAYVGRRRGLTCTPDEVMVTSGTTHGLALVLGTLDPGSVAVEDPGYTASVEVASSAGFDVVDVPVDEQGFDVAALTALARDDVRAVYVTPAHQHPTGATLSAGRRVALVAEASRRGCLLVEDDYDSEFRYDVAPLPALASLSREVVYLGTASKAVHPGLRLGWLVGPSDLVAELVAARERRHDHPSWPVQRAFLAMLRDGHMDRLVRSARAVYARRSALVRSRLEPFTAVQGAGAGMYLTLPLPRDVAAAVVVATREAGFEVPALASYCRAHRRHGVVLGFGGVTDRELGDCLGVIEKVLAGAGPATPAGLSTARSVSQ